MPRDHPKDRIERVLAGWLSSMRTKYYAHQLSARRLEALECAHPLVHARIAEWKLRRQEFDTHVVDLGHFVRRKERLPRSDVPDPHEQSLAGWLLGLQGKYSKGLLAYHALNTLAAEHDLVASHLDGWNCSTSRYDVTIASHGLGETAGQSPLRAAASFSGSAELPRGGHSQVISNALEAFSTSAPHRLDWLQRFRFLAGAVERAGRLPSCVGHERPHYHWLWRQRLLHASGRLRLERQAAFRAAHPLIAAYVGLLEEKRRIA
eukprot:UN0599